MPQPYAISADSRRSLEEALAAASSSGVLLEEPRFGLLEANGDDALDLLHRLTTNDLLRASHHEAVPTVFTTDKGRIVDYALVIPRGSSVLILPSAGNELQVMEWIERFHIMEDVALSRPVPRRIILSLLGPEVGNVVQAVTGIQLRDGFLVPGTMESAGEVEALLTTRFGITAVDILVEEGKEEGVREALRAAGTRLGIPLIGRAAYDALRISRGIPALGSELSESFNPYDVGLVSAISYTKGCFIGQEVIARLDTYQKVKRGLMGVLCSDPIGNPSPPVDITKGSDRVGILTSWTQVPVHGSYMGLGVMRLDGVRSGEAVHIGPEDDNKEGRVLSLPFFPGPHEGRDQ